jgi:hypothetical protein
MAFQWFWNGGVHATFLFPTFCHDPTVPRHSLISTFVFELLAA